MPKAALNSKQRRKAIRYDESLTAFVAVLRASFTDEQLASGWILRNAAGKLSYISRGPVDLQVRKQVAALAEKALGSYAAERESSVLSLDDHGIRGLIDTGEALGEVVRTKGRGDLTVQLLDRRIVGQDWLRQPTRGWESPGPARLVFSSLKGGVGRSTALAVVAVHFASQGRKLLVIDLDLEAPGIGTMLIPPSKKPKYGVLDWYVENTISGRIDEDLLYDMVAPCPFSGGNGVINVAPAVGLTSDRHPGNVLGKIARAYLEMPQEAGRPLTFLAQTQSLIGQLSSQLNYDVILVDARAGLNETTAAALLGLGADVLLFGVDTPQTFASYRYLLANFARFPRSEENDWLYRLRMVHAHASLDAKKQAEFRDRAYSLFSEFFYRDRALLDEGGGQLTSEQGEPLTLEEFSVDDPVAPHYAWPILWDPLFAEFDPFNKRTAITQEFYSRSFSALIKGVHDLISAEESV
jgi:Mrp family chromosome partitioning ATPase